MPLKKSEKQLLGIMMLVGAGAIFMFFGLPAWDTLSKNWTKKDELNGQLKNFTVQEQALTGAIKRLEKQLALPNDVTVRKYTDATLQQNVKDILNRVIEFADNANNTVAYLKPWVEVPSILPPPPPPDPAAAQTAGATTTPTDPNTPPAPPPPPPLTTVGYELAIRGTFASVQEFLTAMDAQKEMVEIYSLQLINESGPARGAGDASSGGGASAGQDAILDPAKPIKLIAKLRLVLEPVTTPTSPTGAMTSPPTPPATQ